MRMRACVVFALLGFLQIAFPGTAGEVSSFNAYVDSDICARLMLGPIDAARVTCSQQTYKDGSDPVLVQLTTNQVLTPNKTKMIKGLVGQLARVSGEIKVKDSSVKLAGVTPIEASAIPGGDPGRKLLDVRTFRAVDAPLYEKIRHELAMMPYISEFDFISFSLMGNDVILSGWTVRTTNRSDSQNIVKNIEGVGSVVNNIDVLPLGSFDMQIRAGARAAL